MVITSGNLCEVCGIGRREPRRIREDFLKPWGMTPYRLAKGLGISQSAVADILKGERAVTAATALRLSAFLGLLAQVLDGAPGRL
jgi:addiction module HigA family antidote